MTMKMVKIYWKEGECLLPLKNCSFIQYKDNPKQIFLSCDGDVIWRDGKVVDGEWSKDKSALDIVIAMIQTSNEIVDLKQIEFDRITQR